VNGNRIRTKESHAREGLADDVGAEPLLRIRERLLELGHVLGEVQQRRAAAGHDALLQCGTHNRLGTQISARVREGLVVLWELRGRQSDRGATCHSIEGRRRVPRLRQRQQAAAPATLHVLQPEARNMPCCQPPEPGSKGRTSTAAKVAFFASSTRSFRSSSSASVAAPTCDRGR
jgi:hypothetical protein